MLEYKHQGKTNLYIKHISYTVVIQSAYIKGSEIDIKIIIKNHKKTINNKNKMI